MLKTVKRKKRAFTVAELLVATAITSLFLGAVFSLYRAGSNMFAAGSWKYARQKEAEFFLNIMKERIEQTSEIVKIDPTSTSGSAIVKAPTKFVTIAKNGTQNKYFSGGSGDIWLAEFVVGKPDMTKVPGNSYKNKKGLVAYHSIKLTPSGTPGLWNLEMRADVTPDDAKYFKSSGTDFPPNFISGLSPSEFKDYKVASEYGIAPLPATYMIHDVASVTVECGKATESFSTDTGNVQETSPLFCLHVEMKNPKHEKTVLILNRKARINSNVTLVEKSSI